MPLLPRRLAETAAISLSLAAFVVLAAHGLTPFPAEMGAAALVLAMFAGICLTGIVIFTNADSIEAVSAQPSRMLTSAHVETGRPRLFTRHQTRHHAPATDDDFWCDARRGSRLARFRPRRLDAARRGTGLGGSKRVQLLSRSRHRPRHGTHTQTSDSNRFTLRGAGTQLRPVS